MEIYSKINQIEQSIKSFKIIKLFFCNYYKIKFKKKKMNILLDDYERTLMNIGVIHALG